MISNVTGLVGQQHQSYCGTYVTFITYRFDKGMFLFSFNYTSRMPDCFLGSVQIVPDFERTVCAPQTRASLFALIWILILAHTGIAEPDLGNLLCCWGPELWGLLCP